ncbi:hypothetical protein L1887_51478 [Cichorium endivia]|nr:hypothetical protein L1887_51478 [Cichorium endivia]
MDPSRLKFTRRPSRTRLARPPHIPPTHLAPIDFSASISRSRSVSQCLELTSLAETLERCLRSTDNPRRFHRRVARVTSTVHPNRHLNALHQHSRLLFRRSRSERSAYRRSRLDLSYVPKADLASKLVAADPGSLHTTAPALSPAMNKNTQDGRDPTSVQVLGMIISQSQPLVRNMSGTGDVTPPSGASTPHQQGDYAAARTYIPSHGFTASRLQNQSSFSTGTSQSPASSEAHEELASFSSLSASHNDASAAPFASAADSSMRRSYVPRGNRSLNHKDSFGGSYGPQCSTRPQRGICRRSFDALGDRAFPDFPTLKLTDQSRRDIIATSRYLVLLSMRATVHLWLSRLDSRVSVIMTLSRVSPTLWRCWGARPRTPSTTLPPRASRDPLRWPMPTLTSLWPLLLTLLLDSKAPTWHRIPTTPPSRQAPPTQQHRIARKATVLPPPTRRRRLLQTGPASKQSCPDCRKSAA